jgi:F-type H+-transporting ATPase subunit gamma
MPSVKDLGKRLKSVTSTSKITKAMKMVAASKLRHAETAMLKARPFAASVSNLMMEHISVAEEDVLEKPTMIAVSSDKGLCGGINSKVVKQIKIMLDAPDAPAAELLIVGGKARDGLSRTHGKSISAVYDEAYKGPVTFSLASFLAEQMLVAPADSYTIIFNKFTSVISQEVSTMTFKGPEALGGSGVMDEYEFEGDKEVVLADLYQFNLACSLYGCLLENVTSEQASRMTAMDSASNNATDMIAKLQLQYNRLRQAKITTELTEIVAGAESVS